jgi:hypothetical protein
LKEKHGGEVVCLSMGREEAARVLRSSLAMGADRAIHLLDPKFKGADEFAATVALAKAIEKDGCADLLLAGVQSDDLGTGMTGTMMAEFLGWGACHRRCWRRGESRQQVSSRAEANDDLFKVVPALTRIFKDLTKATE